MKALLFGSALAAAAMVSPASAATTVFVSDFEDEVANSRGWAVVDSTGVWTKENGTSGIELQFNGTGGATRDPATNKVKVELDSNSNSGMFYTFLEDGIYSLEFFFSPRPNVPAESNGIDLLVDSVLLGSYTGGPTGATVWTQQTIPQFTAFAGQKLIFRATGTSDSLGGYLDDITLKRIGAVPEPGTWMLMILGLGAVGFAMRRRQADPTRVSFV